MVLTDITISQSETLHAVGDLLTILSALAAVYLGYWLSQREKERRAHALRIRALERWVAAHERNDTKMHSYFKGFADLVAQANPTIRIPTLPDLEPIDQMTPGDD